MTHGQASSPKHADFERAIVQGFNVFRQLHANNGGFADFYANAHTLTFRTKTSRSAPDRVAGP